MRILVRVLSLLGIGAHFLFIMLLGTASVLSDSSSFASGRAVTLLASPFVYFGYCLLSSFGHWRRIPLLISGIAAHLCIVPFLARLIHDGVWFFGFPIIIMALCWTGMLLESKRRHDS